jgi:hypothetical protein
MKQVLLRRSHGRPTHMGENVVNAMYVNVGNVHHSVECEKQNVDVFYNTVSSSAGRCCCYPPPAAQIVIHPSLLCHLLVSEDLHARRSGQKALLFFKAHFTLCSFYYCSTYYNAVRMGGGGDNAMEDMCCEGLRAESRPRPANTWKCRGY